MSYAASVSSPDGGRGCFDLTTIRFFRHGRLVPAEGDELIVVAAGNGTISFTDLRIDAAGSGKQLTASAGGLSSVSWMLKVRVPAVMILARPDICPTAPAAGPLFPRASAQAPPFAGTLRLRCRPPAA